MMTRQRRLGVNLVIGVSLILILERVMSLGGFCVNISSRSLPYGLYQISDALEPDYGDYALTCLEGEAAQMAFERMYIHRGRCPSGLMPVMKRIAAKPGDQIDIKNGHVRINGEALSQYPVRAVDSRGDDLRVLYQTPMIINPGYYYLLSDYHPRSWDSRYWGQVKIYALARPVVSF